MTLTLRRALLPLILAAGLPAVAAAQTVYSCAPSDMQAAGNWIAPEIVVAWEAGADSATVNDAVIATFVGTPVKAKIDADNDRRVTFSWRVKTEAGGQKTTMIYRLTMQKADLSASFIAVPQGYSNTFQTQGRCRKVQG